MTTSANLTPVASTSKHITVTYALYPPNSTNPPMDQNNNQIPTTQTTLHPLEPISTTGSESSKHYAALGPALRESQRVLMESLSGWKDAIGDAEKGKEDPGTPGFGRGKAALMSEGVMDAEEEDSEDDDDDEDGEVEVEA